MTRDEFGALFLECTKRCVAFAREFVHDSLPDDVIYRIYPNASYDEHPLQSDEVVFPEDTLRDANKFRLMNFGDAVAFLYRDGRVPEWVDMSVKATTRSQTVIALMCCGRFTANRERWYYERWNQGPFACKSPVIPARFGIEGDPRQQGKFWLADSPQRWP